MLTAGQEITDGTVVWKVIDTRAVEIQLYDTTGQNTDGSMTQAAITSELNTKLNVGATATNATTAFNIPTSPGNGNIWIS